VHRLDAPRFVAEVHEHRGPVPLDDAVLRSCGDAQPIDLGREREARTDVVGELDAPGAGERPQRADHEGRRPGQADRPRDRRRGGETKPVGGRHAATGAQPRDELGGRRAEQRGLSLGRRGQQRSEVGEAPITDHHPVGRLDRDHGPELGHRGGEHRPAEPVGGMAGEAGAGRHHRRHRSSEGAHRPSLACSG
jgi:hypothetical protein